MSLKLQTEQGHAIPPAPRHSVTVHLPTWANVLRFADKDMELLKTLKSMYPRMMLHRDVKELVGAVIQHAGVKGQSCFLFSSPSAPADCKEFATSTARGDNALSPDDVSIRTYDINAVRLYAFFFPAPKTPVVQPFWTNAGVGISSRLAEECLKHVSMLKDVTDGSTPPHVVEAAAHGQLRERIVGLLKRAPAAPHHQVAVSPDDVYLYETGMASIYRVHKYLLSEYNSSSVLFGFAFFSTIRVFEDFGPGSKMLGLGTAEELDQLEKHLDTESSKGKKVQAVWTEIPSNPLLGTPDLARLRKLADKYHFVLIVDDTIGSFCNIDVLGYADVLITSLTKSFSGYADVMGASAVLNPKSPIYSDLKALFGKSYQNHLYNGDAEVLEHNSRDYLSRSTILNNNAQRLVDYLQTEASKTNSSVAKVYYPTTSPSLANYQAHMRASTEEFVPGYGCLFSVEFVSVEATIAFYDNLNVHCGPHLGAHRTIQMPYVKAIYGKELEWANKYNLRETQVRISVGLEDSDLLLADFELAVRAADAIRG